MGLLTKNDATIYRRFFKEMARLRGQTVLYQYLIKNYETIHGEVIPVKLSDPIAIDVIFNENPSIKTLKRLGWLSIDPDDKPYIMQMPYDTPNLTVDAEVSIQPVDSIGKPTRFRITEIRTLLEFPDCYTCRVAPVPESDDPKNVYDTGYNYVKNPKEQYCSSPMSYINTDKK